jgi:probable phosphoglycerate mutase
MPTDLPGLFLTRHGDTAWTDSRHHNGRTDVPLNERGEVAARADHIIARVRGIDGEVLAFSGGHINRMIVAR